MPLLKKWWIQYRSKALQRAMSSFAGAIGKSLRLKIVNHESFEACVRNQKGAILFGWHGRAMIPVTTVLRNRGFYSMVSQSRDGTAIVQTLTRLGFKCIRGSTNRGGVRVMLEAVKLLKNGSVVALTPDGPRGPAYVIQPSALYMAQKAQSPIVPIGAYATPCIFMKSWDNYLIPFPFAKACIVFGDPITISPTATEEDIRQLVKSVEDAMNEAQRKAEAIVLNKEAI